MPYATLFLVALLLFFLAIIIYVVQTVLSPPSNYPKNIPTIPFYYSLLPLFKDVDQEELYRKHLRQPLAEHGAVKIYFGARWNILVQRPAFMAEVFKHEDVFAKSGNQKKIPYSVIASYTGDNVISAHGEQWKAYAKIVKPGLQEEVPTDAIYRNVQALIRILLEEQQASRSGSVMVMQPLQRYALANLAECLLGTNFQTLEDPNSLLNRMQSEIKGHIFHPIFLNFPFLDKFNLRSRQRARVLIREFQDQLCNAVRKNHTHAHDTLTSSHLGCRMLAAEEEGVWTNEQLRHNMTVLFLAAHENPQILFSSVLFMLAEHQDVQQSLREEVLYAQSSGNERELHELPLLTAVIYETLRMYPPLSQVINRRTATPAWLGSSILIPEDTYVGYNCYSTNRDPSFWGYDADEFRPSRWGATVEEANSLFRRATSKATFISFHGGRRACLGQKFAMLETRITVAELVKDLAWELDPGWNRRMTPAGPLFARNLRIKFTKR